jgi:hypothetical protein
VKRAAAIRPGSAFRIVGLEEASPPDFVPVRDEDGIMWGRGATLENRRKT